MLEKERKKEIDHVDIVQCYVSMDDKWSSNILVIGYKLIRGNCKYRMEHGGERVKVIQFEYVRFGRTKLLNDKR